jgi:hypothetical protein
MERYIQSAHSELPRETIPQALKNMIQVLDNSRIFDTQPLLFEEVKRLMQSFVPELAKEIFAPVPAPAVQVIHETPSEPKIEATESPESLHQAITTPSSTEL